MELILIIFLITLVYYLFLLRNFLFGSKNIPPGPNMFQNLLNISELVRKPHIAFNKLSKIYGPLISFRLGGQLFVVASTADLARKIYKTHSPIFTGRYLPSLLYNVPGAADSSIVLLKECNERWKFLRGLTQNSFFSAKAIRSSSVLRKSKIMELMKFLRDEKIGQTVNVEEMIYAAFINVMSNGLVSRDMFEIGGAGEKDVTVKMFFIKMIDKCSPFGLSDVFPLLKGLDFWGRKKAMELFRGIELIWGDTVVERRRSRDVDPSNESSDFLDVLLGAAFSDVQILAMLTELLSGGADSSTIASVWLIAELIKNQEMLHKVRTEILEIAVEGNTLNESLLSKCRYFQACIKEALRLYPGPIGLPRCALDTCNVDGYLIPKGTVVMINTWAIQVDPNNWEDPHSFKPERFLDSKVESLGNHYEFLPFSSGQRMCPGRNLGITSVEMVVASLIHYFEWSLPNGEDPSKLDMSARFSTLLKKEKPLYLIPKLRYKIM